MQGERMSREERGRSITRKDIKSAKSIFLKITATIFALCSLLFISCPMLFAPDNDEPLPPEGLPPGHGWITISIAGDKINRNIVPDTLTSSQIDLFILNFSNADTDFSENRDDTGLKNDPVIIEEGEWTLEVKAFINDLLVAKGERTINIKAGEYQDVIISLDAILEGVTDGQGAFNWDITIDDLEIMPISAYLRLKTLSDDYIIICPLLNIAKDSFVNLYLEDSKPLNIGFYQLILSFEFAPEANIENFEYFAIVYIYLNLESKFIINLTKSHFHNSLFTVTFAENNDQHDPKITVLPYTPITNPPVNPIKSITEGLYLNLPSPLPVNNNFLYWADSSGNEWNMADIVTRNMTLYPKWQYEPIALGSGSTILHSAVAYIDAGNNADLGNYYLYIETMSTSGPPLTVSKGDLTIIGAEPDRELFLVILINAGSLTIADNIISDGDRVDVSQGGNLTLAGNGSIRTNRGIILNMLSGNNSVVNIADGWNGQISQLDLTGIGSVSEIINDWEGKQVLTGVLTPAIIDHFNDKLGTFANNAQEIRDTHLISADGRIERKFDLYAEIATFGVENQDKTILVPAGNHILDRTAVIPANGKQLTITSEDPLNPAVLLRGTADRLFDVGGAEVTDNANLTIENIIIDGRKDNGYGANESTLFWIEGSGRFTMRDGAVVRNNHSITGGGVIVTNNAKFYMQGGEISGNTATQNSGGLHLSWYGEAIITGGSITKNKSLSSGGGIHISGNAKVNMSDGKITENTAINGAGVFVATGTGTIGDGAFFIMTGGMIGGEETANANKAENNGGGVGVIGGTVILGGTAKIFGNTHDTGTINNVYLTAGDFITLGDGTVATGLADTPADGMNVWVRTPSNNPGDIIVSSGADVYNGKYFHADQSNRTVALYDTNPQLVLAEDVNENRTGDPGAPFIVHDLLTLYRVGREANVGGWTLSAHYEMTRSFDLSSVPLRENSNWTRIGTPSGPGFVGVFNGNGNTITGIRMTTTENYQGMFGDIGTLGVVRNIGLVDIEIIGNFDNIGGIAGRNSGRIESCYTTGSIEGNNNVGGIVGYNNVSQIENCFSTSDIEGNSFIGGIVGAYLTSNNNDFVRNCFATGIIKGSIYVGGIVGNSQGSVSETSIQNCVALNQSITAANNTQLIGRIIGNDNPNMDLNNNHAWENMIVTVAGSNIDARSNNPNSLHGADIPTADVIKQSIWTTAGFDFTPNTGTWVWDATGVNMPALRDVGDPQPWPDRFKGGITILIEPLENNGLKINGLTDNEVHMTTAESRTISITNWEDYTSIQWMWTTLPLSSTNTLVISGAGAPFDREPGRAWINLTVVRNGTQHITSFEVIVTEAP